jgi:hypothetical protein
MTKRLRAAIPTTPRDLANLIIMFMPATITRHEVADKAELVVSGKNGDDRSTPPAGRFP